jgi:hypothetical protein
MVLIQSGDQPVTREFDGDLELIGARCHEAQRPNAPTR